MESTILTKLEHKLQLATRLKLDGKAQPIRRVWIDKPGKKEKRPLGIPVISDRAKQQLARLAFEPVFNGKQSLNQILMGSEKVEVVMMQLKQSSSF